ncbi:MAG: hypothetical protein K0R90_802 [Oscillospiraceae bacterium]|jgi:hypothetical protein|nr:hypothetical protein [Oscillospiraceae bacterium]
MFKDFFSNLTAQKKNILFLVVEVVVVLAIVIGATLGVFFSANGDDSGKVVSSSSSTASTGSISSLDGLNSDLTSDGLSSTESSSTDSNILTPVSSDSNVTDPGTTDPGTTDPNSGLENVMTWSDNQFLPNLANEPAAVMDYIDQSAIAKAKYANEELLMFTSLKGIVNRSKPRIYTADTDPAKGYNTWLEKLKIKLNKVSDPYTLIKKYRSEIKGIVIYDDTDKRTFSTINLATTIAGVENAIIVSPKLVSTVQKKFNLPVIKDLRKEKFKDKWEIYNYQFEHYANKTTNRVIVGLNPETMFGQIRDYAIAIKANVIYLDPAANKDIEILDKFFLRMPAGKSSYLGWWTQENDGVNYGSAFGVVTIASDWCSNASVYAGAKSINITPQAVSKKPKLENKIYVSLIMADGDNLQYMEGKLREIWIQPERGDFPLTWTMSPPMLDIYKPILNYYNKTKTANDTFVSGPSAYGYFYPKYWARTEDSTKNFAEFLRRSDDNYMKKLGFRSITVWNWESGAMGTNLMKVYADNMPSLYGISQQENMNPAATLFNKDFLVMKLDGSYCGEIYQMEQIIAGKIDEYNKAKGSKPVFVTLQGVPWGIFGKLSSYEGIIDYAESLSGDVEFINLDQLYQLKTEYMSK